MGFIVPPPGCWPFCYPACGYPKQFPAYGEPAITTPSWHLFLPSGVGWFFESSGVLGGLGSLCGQMALLRHENLNCGPDGYSYGCVPDIFNPAIIDDANGAGYRTVPSSWFGIDCWGQNGPAAGSSGGQASCVTGQGCIVEIIGPLNTGTVTYTSIPAPGDPDGPTCPDPQVFDWGSLDGQVLLAFWSPNSANSDQGAILYNPTTMKTLLNLGTIAVYSISASSFNPRKNNTFSLLWHRAGNGLYDVAAATYDGSGPTFHGHGTWPSTVTINTNHWDDNAPPLVGIATDGQMVCSPEMPYLYTVGILGVTDCRVGVCVTITDNGGGECSVAGTYAPTLCWDISQQVWITNVNPGNLSCFQTTLSAIMASQVANGLAPIGINCSFCAAQLTPTGELTVWIYKGIDYTSGAYPTTSSFTLVCTITITGIDMDSSSLQCACVLPTPFGPVLTSTTTACSDHCSVAVTVNPITPPPDGTPPFCYSGGPLRVIASPSGVVTQYIVSTSILTQVPSTTHYTGTGFVYLASDFLETPIYRTEVGYNSADNTTQCTLFDDVLGRSIEIQNSATINVVGNCAIYDPQVFDAAFGALFYPANITYAGGDPYGTGQPVRATKTCPCGF